MIPKRPAKPDRREDLASDCSEHGISELSWLELAN